MNNFIAVIFLLFFVSACGNSGTSTDQKEVAADRFDTVRAVAKTQLSQSDGSAVSVAIYKDGDVVFSEAFGNKSSNSDDPVDENTLFQIGSTTKMLTAIATLRQVDAGVFSVDDGLTDLLPGIQVEDDQVSSWNEITLHHLMTHQGGFVDFVDWDESSSDLIGFSKNNFPSLAGLMSPAGQFWNYSNPNWAYLGAVLSEQLNKDFPAILDESIFIPLDMPRSSLNRAEVEADGNYALATGLIIRDGDLTEGNASSLDEIPESIFSKPAGSYTWSTPEEMLKVADFIINGNEDLLADEIHARLLRKHIDTQGPLPSHYGYGLFVDDGIALDDRWYPIRAFHHGGNTNAFSSAFFVFPEHNAAVSILASSAVYDSQKVVLEVLKSLDIMPDPLGLPVKEVATELFGQYVGRYKNSGGQIDVDTIDISIEDGDLMIDVPLFNGAGIDYDPTLMPIGGASLLVLVDGEFSELTFIPQQEDGESIYIRNREFVFIKESD